MKSHGLERPTPLFPSNFKILSHKYFKNIIKTQPLSTYGQNMFPDMVNNKV